MKRKRFKKSPLWGISYEVPQLDKRLTTIHKSLKEMEGVLAEKKGNVGKKKK